MQLFPCKFLLYLLDYGMMDYELWNCSWANVCLEVGHLTVVNTTWIKVLFE